VHKHLRRLERTWVASPLYFVTTCTLRRRKVLAEKRVAEILVEEWQAARERHGWTVGRYVIMPDHVHFFCAAQLKTRKLQAFIQKWKEWSSKRASRELQMPAGLWQEEFFDHVLRSNESYNKKWEYVRQNPVRAGLVSAAEDWPWQGEIELLSY
jgi:REP element-mobilizing transposase RayT